MDSMAKIEKDIWEKGSLNREHLLAFLRLQPSTDGPVLAQAVKTWLTKFHADPHFSKVTFPTEQDNPSLGVSGNPIERIIADLSNYGYITHETMVETNPKQEPPK